MHINTRIDGCDNLSLQIGNRDIVDGLPVTYHKAVKAHFALKNIIYIVGVLVHFYAIDAAVRDHDRFYACIHQIPIYIQQSLDFESLSEASPLSMR